MTPNVRCCLLALSTLLAAVGCASTSSGPGDTAMAKEPTVANAEDPGPVTIDREVGPSLEPIYFETDRSLLRSEAREMLQRYAKEIVSHPEWGVLTIEGHCDERGSDEYNLALGGRRAAAVQQYLLDLGVPTARLTTRTFGEEHPAVAGHDEGAWRYNRRSEISSPGFESASR